VVDEQSAHGLRTERQAVRAAMPIWVVVVQQFEPRLVDQRRRLERVVVALAFEVSAQPHDAARRQSLEITRQATMVE
jgi:hypothetical protein